MNNIVTLKSRLWVTQSLKAAPLESLVTVSYSPTIVTMALYCIVLEIKRDIGRKSGFFSYPLALDAPLGGGFPSEYYHTVWYGKTRMGLAVRW